MDVACGWRWQGPSARLHRLARREAAQRCQGGSPRLCANPWHLCLEAVRYWSGGGPMWIVQIPDIKPLAELIMWLCVLLSAPCIDGAGTVQPRRIPHVDCATHWH